MDKVTNRQWLFLKLAALLMCLPLASTFLAATVNNAPLGIKSIIAVYGYICLLSLGWPLWTLFSTFEVFKKRARGVRWMRNISILWVLIFVPVAVIGFFDPHFADSEPAANQVAVTLRDRITPFFIVLPMLFPAYYGWKISKLLKTAS